MNPESLKKLIAVLASFAILVIAYYGNYLPLQKSKAFIMMLRKADTVRTVGEFQGGFAEVLEMPSPIGQEELVRNMGGMVINIINNSGANTDVTESMIQFLTKYYKPIMDADRGMSFTQNLYVLGNANAVASFRTKNPKYLEAAKNYYERGLKLGPDRPQFLYGLFDVYRIEGDVAKTSEIANKILTLWPGDERARKFYDEFIAAVAKARGAPSAAAPRR